MLAINADGKEKEEDDDGADSALRLCLCTRFLKHVCSRETGLVMTDSQELRGQTDVTGKAKANFRGKIRRTLRPQFMLKVCPSLLYGGISAFRTSKLSSGQRDTDRF